MVTPEQQAVIDAAVELVEACLDAYPPGPHIGFPSDTKRIRVSDAEDALAAAVERMQAVRG